MREIPQFHRLHEAMESDFWLSSQFLTGSSQVEQFPHRIWCESRMLIRKVSMTEAGVFAEPVTQVSLTAPGQGSKDALNARIDAAELVFGNRLDGNWCKQTSRPGWTAFVRNQSSTGFSVSHPQMRGGSPVQT